jgi:hypothetical protein
MTHDEIDQRLLELFKPHDVRIENDGKMIGGCYHWAGLKATQWSPSQFFSDVEPLIQKACALPGRETWFESGYELFYHESYKWTARFDEMTNDKSPKHSLGATAAEAAARALVAFMEAKEAIVDTPVCPTGPDA